ncbi:MAG TPA: sodium ion-translocating decarboxylase subunit beta [Clostridiales bacterium]|nr:sodium ion-translocating decarboxylase subunit beta [Clostridiales bacterium]HQP70385.1 sodium ion-translocating decarboxylase subunit beta [Clostridiales bacterium]
MEGLMVGLTSMTWQMLVMMMIGGTLIFLAVKKNYEPTLLLPIGFGAILANIPYTSVLDQVEGGHVVEGALSIFFRVGILTEIFPLLIFVAIGAMIDFSPLFRNPKLLLFGAAAQFGIFFTMILATLLGFDIKEAASIGVIGSADGPTSIYVATRFAPNLLGPISVAAYSYMALVPIIQPPIIKMLTTKEERMMRMDGGGNDRKISRATLVLFPILVTILTGLFAPTAVALIGFLMFGNLVRECGVLNKLSLAAQNELASLVTLLLGITIASTMTADRFLQVSTLFIIGLGLIAFMFDTAGGVLFAKLLNFFLKKKVNPMIGAAGISAFPMSSRVIHTMGLKEDPTNYLLMHAVSANVSGQIGSVLAGGLILALVH